MISTKLQIAMLLAVGLYFLIVLRLLRQKTLNLKYTLLWLASGLIMLLLAVFPQLLGWFSTLVGIYDPTNALFSFVFFCVIIILMSLTAIVSKLNEKSKQTVQAMALMERRIRNLEKNSEKEMGAMQGDETNKG